MAINKTRLHKKHIEHNAKMVDFSGWNMPINYGSQINEHNIVRSSAGIFDVSHMTVFDLSGSEQKAFLRKLLPNDIGKIINYQKGLYSPLLDKSGNILDDLIVYNMGNNFRIISNCATSVQNHEWFIKQSTKFDVGVCLNEDVSIIAVQGPESIKILNKIGYNDINNLSNFDIKFDASVMIAKTGYTGEEGFEIILNNSEVVSFWEKLIDVGASPIGLGARDTLRLEAGLNLYGVDMDQTNNPYESNLSWTIDFNDSDRDFIGKKALSLIDKNTSKELKGVILKERGILRSGQVISHENGAGKILSGTFSPTLGYSIGMARLDKGHNNKGKVLIRNKEFNIEIISLPFIRKGKMRL